MHNVKDDNCEVFWINKKIHFYDWLPKYGIFLCWLFTWFSFAIDCVYICDYSAKNRLNSLFFSHLVAEISSFFEANNLNCGIFYIWLHKYAVTSPKIGKIHTFFTVDYFKCAIFVSTGSIIHSYFRENQQKSHVFCNW